MKQEILDWAEENDLSPEDYFDWEIEEMYERACKRMAGEEDGESCGDFIRGN